MTDRHTAEAVLRALVETHGEREVRAMLADLAARPRGRRRERTRRPLSEVAAAARREADAVE